MLSPKRIKYRKPHKGNLKGMANSGNYVCYGTYGMKALESGWITNRQIEAGRISLSRRVRKIGRLWIRIFPNKSITKEYFLDGDRLENIKKTVDFSINLLHKNLSI